MRIIALCIALLSPAHAASTPTLLIVGDSLSAGYQIPPGRGWVDLLSKELAPDIRVVNDSISGDTTAGGVARLPATLQRVKPDWVVIELGGNDGLRGSSLNAMENNLAEMVRLTYQQGAQPILFGMKLPPNYGAHYTAAFENVFVRVAEDADVPLLPFFLSGIENDPSMFQHDGIHPTAAAQGRLMENVRAFLMDVIKTN